MPSADERIPLSPITTPPAPDPTAMIRRLWPFDKLLILALMIFAFLVASFKAANSDVLLHLATGRLVAQGAYPFGQDPFTFTAREWVNPTWFYSLQLFALYELTGPNGVGLIVLKALLVVMTTFLMVMAGKKPGERDWITVMCVALGVLVMSPRLLLSPILFSLLFLALVFLLLTRHEVGSRRVWFVPLLCMVWVNCDAWFFLGPLTVLLFAVGETLQGGKEVSKLGLVFAASVMACIVNPYHVMAFTALPPELLRTTAAVELARDPMFRGWHLSVFEPTYYQLNVGMSAAGIAYFVLVAAGVASFALAFPRLHSARALLFVLLLGLSLLGYRMIPLFAVLAAPIAALNFLDGADRLFGSEAFVRREWRAWAFGGRFLSFILLVAACTLSVPGLLQALPHSARRLDFGIEIDEGLRDAALRVKELRDQGAIPPNQRWLNIGPEVVAYFAWFCPGERCFLDHRIGIYSEEVVQDYLAARRALQGEDRPNRQPGQEPPEPGWRGIMRDRLLFGVVFHANNIEAYRPMLNRFYGSPDEWTPCYLGGRSSLFAWREVGSRLTLDARAIFNFNAAAFGPSAVVVGDPTPIQLTFLDALTGEVPPTSASAWTATQHLSRYAAVSDLMRQENDRLFLSIVAGGLIGTSNGPAIASVAGVPWRFGMRSAFLTALDSGPPASAYLALRSAREAIGTNPHDYRGYHAFAQAVSLLSRDTRERSRTEGRLPFVGILRRSQTVWALREALRREPSAPLRQLIHLLMMETMQGLNYLDLYHEQATAYIKLARELRFMPIAPPDQIGKAVEEFEKGLRAQERELERRRDEFVVQSARLPAAGRALKALERGLVQEAIRALSSAKLEELAAPLDRDGTTGLQLLVQLRLELGQVDEARSLLNPETSPGFDPRMLGFSPLGGSAYDWFRIQIAATVGDYDSADAALADMLSPSASSSGARIVPVATAQALLQAARSATSMSGDHLTRIGLPFPVQEGVWPLSWQGWLGLAEQNALDVLDRQGVILVLRGWIALERGRVADAHEWATKAFERADLGPAPNGGRMVLQLRSLPLAVLIRQFVPARQ